MPSHRDSTMALPWASRSVFRPSARSLGVLDPRRGVPHSSPRREGGGTRDAGRVAHGPRLARRRGGALPGGQEHRHQTDHRLRGLRRGRPPRTDEGVRPPDAAGRVERGLRQPHQALVARLPRGVLLQATRRLGAPQPPRERDRRALRLPVRSCLAGALGGPRPRTRTRTSTASSRSSGATRRTWRSRTPGSRSRRR